MKKVLYIILISIFSLTILSCAKEEEKKTEAPVIASSDPDPAPAISVGDYHSCALLDNASVKCWGNNSKGQLGIDSNTNMGDNSGEMDLLLGIDL